MNVRLKQLNRQLRERRKREIAARRYAESGEGQMERIRRTLGLKGTTDAKRE